MMEQKVAHKHQPSHENFSFEQHQIFLRTFGRLDPLALAISLALMFAIIFAAVIFGGVLQNADDLKQQLDLLGKFFPNFRTTFPESLLCIPYGAFLGFLTGYSFAVARNIAVRAVLNFIELTNFTTAIESTLDD